MATNEILDVIIYTDGACSGNPGPGGWGVFIMVKGKNINKKITLRGGSSHTTNNRMELQAAIEALEFIKKNIKKYDCRVELYSDSSYVVNTINKGSLKKWANNGWITTSNTEAKNKDLWEQMLKVVDHHKPTFIKVKGHSGVELNEKVDGIATEEAMKYKNLDL